MVNLIYYEIILNDKIFLNNPIIKTGSPQCSMFAYFDYYRKICIHFTHI